MILAHAVSNAIIASIQKYFDKQSSFAHTMETSGLALSHWHGYFNPNLIPKGIKLKHYMPVNAVSNMERWTHNFKIYSLRLNNITEREMWMALGFSKVGSSKMAKIVEKYNDRINLDLMRKAIGRLRAEDDINVASLGSIYDKLSDVEASGLFDTSKHRELDMMADWKDGNSICISYNARNKMFMSFDIGEKIFRCAKLYNSGERETPVFFIFDDSSYYADHIPEAYVDYAVQEISAIGFHYRTSKIYNMMAVHSLGIINSNVAEGYPIKIITHQFAKPESLAEINVPRQAIDMLKYNLLYKNKDRHVYQWILINENNEVIPFFPFMPVCNHFEEVYFPRDAKDINKEIINNEVEA